MFHSVESDTEYSNSDKIVLLGAAGVGKTCILNRYINNEFIDICNSTIGVDFFHGTIPLDENKSKTFTLWDTAGQERFRGVASSYFKGAVGAIIVFDLTDLDSFNKCGEYYKEVVTYSQENTVVFLIGNKSDLISECRVTDEEAEAKCQELNARGYFKVSAKEDNGEIGRMFTELAKFIELRPKKEETEVMTKVIKKEAQHVVETETKSEVNVSKNFSCKC